MSKKKIEEEFYFLFGNNKKYKIENNSIYITYNDPYFKQKLGNLYAILAGLFIFTFANRFSQILFFIIIGIIVEIFKHWGMYFICLFSLILPCIIWLISPRIKEIINKFFYSYKVIDLNKEAFYTLQCIYGETTKFDYIYFKDIIKFCNNVIPQKSLPFEKGKKDDIHEIGLNPNTNLFHNYYFSFLLKNGELINYINFGYSGKEYDLTVKLASILSKNLQKELSTCNNYSTFEVEKISEDCEYYNLESHKITDKDLSKYEETTELDLTVTSIIIISIFMGLTILTFKINVDYKYIDVFFKYLKSINK